MSTVGYPYRSIAIEAPASARATFIRLTYIHLAGAILAFVGLEFAIFKLGFAQSFMSLAISSPGMMIALMIAFIGSSYLANWWARSAASRALQYAGLGLYVLVEAVIFIPMLTYVNDLEIRKFGGSGALIGQAGVMTMAIFVGLSITALVTRKDYSFLGPIISIACALAFGLLIAGMFFGGFSLGLWFSLLMVAVASASILYETSNMLHYYRTDQYVAASLGLFASVALLFYYILRILYFSNRD